MNKKYTTRLNQKTYEAEVNICGTWICLEDLETGIKIVGEVEFYNICRENFSMDVVDGIREYVENK